MNRIKEERSSWATDSFPEPWQQQPRTIGCSSAARGGEIGDE